MTKTPVQIAITVFALTLICSCSSDEYMEEHFGNGALHEFTEKATGDTYLVEHRIGENYSVRLLRKAKP